MQTDLSERLKNAIRDVPDFPKPGIIFKDITPVLRDAALFHETVQALAGHAREKHVTAIVGIESRGFIFGAAVADTLRVGFVPVRKPGKLPAETLSQTYELEYGTDTLEIHRDALMAADQVLIVDDLLATGGTAVAAVNLVKQTGAGIAGLVFVVELGFLAGRTKLSEYDSRALINYEG